MSYPQHVKNVFDQRRLRWLKHAPIRIIACANRNSQPNGEIPRGSVQLTDHAHSPNGIDIFTRFFFVLWRSHRKSRKPKTQTPIWTTSSTIWLSQANHTSIAFIKINTNEKKKKQNRIVVHGRGVICLFSVCHWSRTRLCAVLVRYCVLWSTVKWCNWNLIILQFIWNQHISWNTEIWTEMVKETNFLWTFKNQKRHSEFWRSAFAILSEYQFRLFV